MRGGTLRFVCGGTLSLGAGVMPSQRIREQSRGKASMQGRESSRGEFGEIQAVAVLLPGDAQHLAQSLGQSITTG